MIESDPTLTLPGAAHQEGSVTELVTDYASVMSAVGRLLRRHRDAAGLTQEELAERAGVSARTVSDIERGLRSHLYADTADRLARALELLDGDLAAFVDAARGRAVAQEVRTSLPRPLTDLVGREAELTAVTAALEDGRRLVTITGLGGVGKTRVALAAADRVERRFAGRVHFLAVPAGRSADLFGTLVASSLCGSDHPDALADHLEGRPTLLVLDSFEHALRATPVLEHLLLGHPELHVLVTSREALRITGEHQVSLGPLEVPEPDDPDWQRAGATRLFLDRARDVGADLRPGPAVVIEICRLLSGLPLALELAAVRLRYLPLATLRDRLREGSPELLGRPPGADDATDAMEETLRWTIESLQPGTARALRAGALLPGGWRLDAMESMCPAGTAMREIAALVDKGLAHVDQSPDKTTPVARWQMLDVVRGYVLATTSDEPDAAWHSAYQAFCSDLLVTAHASLGREREWFRVIEAEEPNVRAALGWAADAGDAEALLGLANGMWFYWQSRGALEEGRHWLELGLGLEPAAGDRTRMTALWGDAMLAHHQGDDVVAHQCAEQLDELAGDRGDDAGLRNAATIRGMVAIAGDRSERAVSEFRWALRLAAGLDDPWIEATSYLNLALGLLNAHAVDEARSALGEALTRYERLEDERFHARSVGYLGLAALLDGDVARSRSLFIDSLRVFHRLGEPGGTAEALTGLAAAEAAGGRPSRSAVLAAAAERQRHIVASRQLPLERRTNERFLGMARAQVGDERWAELWSAGYDRSLDDVVAEALTAPPTAGARGSG